MKQIDIEELKKIQIDILDELMKFCDENGIDCWLNGGTLLGAIRHKGYIPWDDDIDVGMLRPDYEKFIELFNKYNTRYRLVSPEIDSNYPRFFGRVYDPETFLIEEGFMETAIHVDIFPWDNAPDDDKALRSMLLRKHIFRRLYLLRWPPVFHNKPLGNIFRRIWAYSVRFLIHSIPSFVLPVNYFPMKMIQNAKRFISHDTKRIGEFVGPPDPVVSRKAFENFIYAEYEGKKYKVPEGYDEVLRGLYGDYMQFPPEEERAPKHHFTAFIKDGAEK